MKNKVGMLGVLPFVMAGHVFTSRNEQGLILPEFTPLEKERMARNSRIEQIAISQAELKRQRKSERRAREERYRAFKSVHK